VVEKTRGAVIRRGALLGLVSGLAGVAVMTAGEKIEQSLTHRPNSYVPARTLRALLGRQTADTEKPTIWNHAMHWGTGAAVGALRGVWAAVGMRGTYSNAKHTVVRLAVDQTLENTTGVGAPPTSWPRRELVVDMLHKTVYSFVTGIVADRLIAPRARSLRGPTSN
jgi:hypothetical protein